MEDAGVLREPVMEERLGPLRKNKKKMRRESATEPDAAQLNKEERVRSESPNKKKKVRRESGGQSKRVSLDSKKRKKVRKEIVYREVEPEEETDESLRSPESKEEKNITAKVTPEIAAATDEDEPAAGPEMQRFRSPKSKAGKKLFSERLDAEAVEAPEMQKVGSSKSKKGKRGNAEVAPKNAAEPVADGPVEEPETKTFRSPKSKKGKKVNAEDGLKIAAEPVEDEQVEDPEMAKRPKVAKSKKKMAFEDSLDLDTEHDEDVPVAEPDKQKTVKSAKAKKKNISAQGSPELVEEPIEEEIVAFDESAKGKNGESEEASENVAEPKKRNRVASEKSKKRKKSSSQTGSQLDAELAEEVIDGADDLKQKENVALEEAFETPLEPKKINRVGSEKSKKKRKNSSKTELNAEPTEETAVVEDPEEAPVTDPEEMNEIVSKESQQEEINTLEEAPEVDAEHLQEERVTSRKSKKKKKALNSEFSPKPTETEIQKPEAAKSEKSKKRKNAKRATAALAITGPVKETRKKNRRKVRCEEPPDDVVEEETQIETLDEIETSDTNEEVEERRRKKRRKVRFEVPDDDVVEEETQIETLDEIETSDTNEEASEEGVVDPEGNSEGNSAHYLQKRSWKRDIMREDLKYGKFSPEEDLTIGTAINDYINMKGWEKHEGLQIVLHSSQHPEARGCWVQIAQSLPHRPVKQINSRAVRMLGSEKRGKWSEDEEVTLRSLFSAHGHEWVKIAPLMDRPPGVCKDKWRKLRISRKVGKVTDEELDKLCKLVRRCMRMKAGTLSKDLDRRELRDDINWDWISEQMLRVNTVCSALWYKRLASQMISQQRWANGDDRLLLQSLLESGVSSEEAVNWDTVLNHRDGRTCLQRWKEMSRMLVANKNAAFKEQLKCQVRRFAPDIVGISDE